MAFTIIFYIFFIGAAIGSFLNVLIDRLPKDKSIMGRSRCDYCKRKLSVVDLIPLFSFLFLNGKCRTCKKKLSWQYPGIELLTGIIFVIIFNVQYSTLNQFSNISILNETLNNWSLIGYWLLIIVILAIASTLIVIFFTDLKYQIIPDQMQIALFIFGFILQIFYILQVGCENGQLLNCYIVKLLYVLGEGVVVMVPILLIYIFTKGRGMGFGDVKLAFNMGILLGIKSGLLGLYFGFITGAIYGLILIVLKKKKMKSKVAFGPFLILGIVIVVVFKEVIYDFLLRVYGIQR